MLLSVLCLLISGVPQPVSAAIDLFSDGRVYMRTIGMEPETDFTRDHDTGLPVYTDGCETSAQIEWEIELWNETMKKLWSSVNMEETWFSIRVGNETLEYTGYQLVYSSGETHSCVTVFPEEVWTLVHHAMQSNDPATGQILLEAWYPAMQDTMVVFVTSDSNLEMRTVNTLLERARNSVL